MSWCEDWTKPPALLQYNIDDVEVLDLSDGEKDTTRNETRHLFCVVVLFGRDMTHLIFGGLISCQVMQDPQKLLTSCSLLCKKSRSSTS